MDGGFLLGTGRPPVRRRGEKKMSGNGDGRELRRHERSNYLGTVHYCLNPQSDGRVLIGSGIDVSQSGMSMFSAYPLKKGQGITIKTKLPVPHQKATVRWIRELREDWYQVGLEFILG
jgi:hypothetical protein